VGFLWVTLSDPLPADRLAVVDEVSERIRDAVVATADEEVIRAAEAREILLGLASPDPGTRMHATARLGAPAPFDGLGHVVAVVGVGTARAAHPDPGWRADLVRAVRHATSRLPARSVMSAIDADRLVLLIGYRTATSADEAERIALAIHRGLAAAAPAAAAGFRLGVSEVRSPVAEAASCLEQAALAARSGASSGPVVRWGEDPRSTLLASVLRDDVPAHLIPEALRRVEASQSPETLALVASFLGNAGNVPAVAAALHLHRATAYERLRRFEAATGLDLADGGTRLMLQLWFEWRRHSSSHGPATGDPRP
jgi:hypothetical protein